MPKITKKDAAYVEHAQRMMGLEHAPTVVKAALAKSEKKLDGFLASVYRPRFISKKAIFEYLALLEEFMRDPRENKYNAIVKLSKNDSVKDYLKDHPMIYRPTAGVEMLHGICSFPSGSLGTRHMVAAPPFNIENLEDDKKFDEKYAGSGVGCLTLIGTYGASKTPWEVSFILRGYEEQWKKARRDREQIARYKPKKPPEEEKVIMLVESRRPLASNANTFFAAPPAALYQDTLPTPQLQRRTFPLMSPSFN